MSEYQTIPLSRLHESTFNPRRHFSEAELTGLSASIASHGVLQPLLVRAHQKQAKGEATSYEIIAGARRFRAAKMAQISGVPVRVVKLSDAEALEAAVIENLQRVDVHPLEEALGFRALLDYDQAVRYDLDMIAAKTGKSKQYVALRMKLADLIEPAQEAFLADQMQLGHALILCRLTPENQHQALPHVWQERWEQQDTDDDDEENESVDVRVLTPVSVRQFSRWCGEHFLLILANAPFDINGALFKEGPCTACPKRSGFNTLLFAEIATDSCTDPICYASKVDQQLATVLRNPAVIKITDSWHIEDEIRATFGGEVLSRQEYTVILDEDHTFHHSWDEDRAKENGQMKPCADMVPAVYVDDEEKGRVVNICHGFTCKIHPRRKPQKSTYKEATSEERKAVRTKELLEARIKTTAAIQTFEAVVAEVPKKMGERELRFVAQSILRRYQWNETDAIAKRWGLLDPKSKQTRTTTEKKIKDHVKDILLSELPSMIVELIVFQSVNNSWHGGLEPAAEAFGVDMKEITKTVRAELVAAAKEKADKAKLIAKAKEAKAKPADAAPAAAPKKATKKKAS
jgi:ParB family chromosome partitioning protein